MSESDAPRRALATKLLELGARFRARNVDDLAALEHCVERLRGGDDEALTEIESIAHRMSGTGATLGFPAISTAAEALERLAESPGASVDRLTAALADLRLAAERGEQQG